ncbi:hypothetical protein AX17_005633 [Amanita inopinata Kibby_2008]|nr:hypothetical protein AX17_005633 [Amanita inopinata Kibby_2008]
MTLAALRALHAIIGDALDDIERVYARASPKGVRDASPAQPLPECSQLGLSSPAGLRRTRDLGLLHTSQIASHQVVSPQLESAYVSPPPSPHVPIPDQSYGFSAIHDSGAASSLDFPSLDAPCEPNSLSEQLTTDPLVVRAINHIVAATGQLAASVQAPFLSLCDASMAYHLPSCLRLLEASHTVEILREAGPNGLHVSLITKQNGIESNKLAHVLRLLATHHIVREVAPDVFTINRISSLIDSGKCLEDLRKFEKLGRPEWKYQDSNGISAFVGLCTDEIHKSSAYLTEAYLLSPSKHTREAREPTSAPFCFAFNTLERKIGFFNWLEGEGSTCAEEKPMPSMSAKPERGPGQMVPPALGVSNDITRRNLVAHTLSGQANSYKLSSSTADENPNRFRLERFGKAMTGTGSWEAPGAIFNGFDWHLLPKNSIVVDVGGGIGSTSMLLASAFSSEEDEGAGLKFIIQDRPVVVELGKKAWKAQCPELLTSGAVEFQVHDFFTPQPVKHAAVFLLRVVLHDWPDDFARRILQQLRYAANKDTRLLIADFVLPHACHDNLGRNGEVVSDSCEKIEGAESFPVPAPLLANLGKANAMVYWMDLTMQVAFNSRERTLRDIVELTNSAGWKVVRIAKAEGSLFGHLTAIPTLIPPRCCESPAINETGPEHYCNEKASIVPRQRPPVDMEKNDMEVAGRAISRCGTPTFGSSTTLPSLEEAIAKFGGRATKSRLPALSGRWMNRASNVANPAAQKPGKPPTSKKKPSPLSVPPPLSSSFPSPVRNICSPKVVETSPTPRVHHLRQPSARFETDKAENPSATHAHVTTSPKSSRYTVIRVQSPTPCQPTLSRRASHAHLSPKSGSNSSHPLITRRASHAQLYKPCISPAPPLPSSIPIRVIQDPVSPAPRRRAVPSSPAAMPQTPILRRQASHAFLTQPARTRANSVLAPPSLRTPVGVGGGIGMGSLLDGGRGTRLQFEKNEHGSTSVERSPNKGPVLAAAANIEKDLRARRDYS